MVIHSEFPTSGSDPVMLLACRPISIIFNANLIKIKGVWSCFFFLNYMAIIIVKTILGDYCKKKYLMYIKVIYEQYCTRAEVRFLLPTFILLQSHLGKGLTVDCIRLPSLFGWDVLCLFTHYTVHTYNPISLYEKKIKAPVAGDD